MDFPKILIGICAYNEEFNIRRILENLISKQSLQGESKILVVCSGCTDRTPEIVKELSKKDTRIASIIESSRKGKANALNKIFKIAKESAEVLVLVNADALPEVGSIEKLISKLVTSGAGAVFAQPVPFEDSQGFSQRIVHVIWRLHHLISLSQSPKLSGELCAIRASVLQSIPEKIATDEPYIELAIRKQGYEILYVPEVSVYIRCPTNVVDFIKHRRRIWIGHMQLQNSADFKVSTSSFQNIFRAIPALKPDEALYALIGGFLEMIAYSEAIIHSRKGVVPHIWKPIESTKTQFENN